MPLTKKAAVFAAALTIGLGVTPAAAQDAVTAEDYEAAMQELRYLATDTSLHIDSSYWGDVGEDSDKIRAELAKVESFWTAQEQPQAVEFAMQAIAAARSIGRASGSQDRNAATSALAELRSVCQSCHAEFREETDDGFRIKPSALR
ncbi:MAG: cytochrome c [Acidobacteria bacterium]|nr:cytochrome c [Acidobacteriota bacterium]